MRSPGSPRTIHVNPRKHQHIPQKYLQNLSTYKYKGTDRSIASNYLFCYFWDWFVEFLPMSMAPNMVTLIGFFIGVSGVFLLLYFFAFQNGNYPSWAWYYASFAVFAYQTLDSVDGKQARRTKTGSPLGELFDHGCDAFITPLLQISIAICLNLTPVQTFAFFIVVGLKIFYTMWEQFWTGELDIPDFGPVEGLILTQIFFLLRGYYGPTFLSGLAFEDGKAVLFFFSPNSTSPFAELFTFLTVRDIVFGVVFYTSMISTFVNWVHVYYVFPLQKEMWTSCLPTNLLLLGYILFALTFRGMDWIPFTLEVSFAFICSFGATRLVIGRLCRMQPSLVSPVWVCGILAPYLLSAVKLQAMYLYDEDDDSSINGGSRKSNFIAEVDIAARAAAVLLCVVTVYQYLHMILSVFFQLSEFLGVHILTLTEKQLKVIAKISNN